MKSEYRDVVNYTLQWVDNWYFDGKAPDIPEEKVHKSFHKIYFVMESN